MYGKFTIGSKEARDLRSVPATLLFGATLAMAQEADPDACIAGWLGKEITIELVARSTTTFRSAAS